MKLSVHEIGFENKFRMFFSNVRKTNFLNNNIYKGIHEFNVAWNSFLSMLSLK